MSPSHLDRFLRHQEKTYLPALKQLQSGKSIPLHMVYIFPRLRILSHNRKTYLFGIIDLQEARAYLTHPILGRRLLICCRTLLSRRAKAEDLFGKRGARELQASLTLFSLVSGENSLFHRALRRLFDGQIEPVTLAFARGQLLDATHLRYRAFGDGTI